MQKDMYLQSLRKTVGIMSGQLAFRLRFEIRTSHIHGFLTIQLKFSLTSWILKIYSWTEFVHRLTLNSPA